MTPTFGQALKYTPTTAEAAEHGPGPWLAFVTVVHGDGDATLYLPPSGEGTTTLSATVKRCNEGVSEGEWQVP